jgi:hypothetical protein
MFDDDELEQIREEQEDWQGHVDRQTVKKSRTSRRLFLSSIGSSVVGVVLLVILVSSGLMSTVALSVAGVGGFTAEIGQLNGTDIAIYPALGPTAACSSTEGGSGSKLDFQEGRSSAGSSATSLPQLRGEVGNAEIPSNQNLVFVKDMAIPNLNFANNVDTFRIKINQSAPSSTPISLGDAELYLTGLEAGDLVIKNAVIQEFYTDQSSNPRFYNPDSSPGDSVISDNADPGEFSIEGEGNGGADASIIDATARAHFIAFDELTLPNVQLSLKYFDRSNPPASVGITPRVADNSQCPHGNNP